MPVYEYQCKACDHEFEREQRISDKPVKKCPECGAMKAKRLISRTSFVLKGGGWYNDLYSSTGKSDAKKDGGDSDAKGKSEGSGDGKESKSGDSKTKKKSSGKSDGKPKGSKAA